MKAIFLVYQLIAAYALVQAPPGIQESDHESRERFTRIAERQFAKTVDYFQLDAKAQGWLREELGRRVEASIENARAASTISSQIVESKRDHEKIKQLMQHLDQQAAKRPLSMIQISNSLKPILPPEQWQAGNERLMRDSKSNQENAAAPEPGAAEVKLRAAPWSAPAEPQPSAILQDSSQTVARVKSEPRDEFTPLPPAPVKKPAVVTPMNQPPQQSYGKGVPPPARLQPAPSIPAAPPSDWERLMREIAARYKFTDAQMHTAQSILKDCERRADAYRKAHAADYDRLSKGADAAQRTTAKAKLDAPITTIGQELRNRLEQIPNAQQRAAAGATSPPKRK